MVSIFQTPSEHEMEMGIKSKEARKYIFNCLDDMMQVCSSFMHLQCLENHTHNQPTVLCSPLDSVCLSNGSVLCTPGQPVLSPGGDGHVSRESR